MCKPLDQAHRVVALLPGVLKNAIDSRRAKCLQKLFALKIVRGATIHHRLFANVRELGVGRACLDRRLKPIAVHRAARREAVGFKYERVEMQLPSALQLGWRWLQHVDRDLPRVIDLVVACEPNRIG